MDKTNYDKGKRLAIRLTSAEKELVSKYANDDGLSLTEYVKRVSLKEVVFSQRIEYTKDLKLISFEIGKVGNNINQLAKHVNRIEKIQNIDHSTINQFHIFMDQYLTLLGEVDITLKQLFKKISKIK